MKNYVLKIILFSAAALMFAAGIAGGEPRVVSQKAVNICLECIGIG
ncbi:MAG: hypothetical protein IJR59_01360 [Firmicutes bacterium]|nr:hypothetical protein [Bacillota bacterium]